MKLRKSIHLLIGLTVLGWWLGTFLLQLLNIYPFNTIVLTYSASGLIVLIILLIIHDLIKFKSIKYVMDFFPDIKGESPTMEEWTSGKVWKSFPKWITALTVLWVIMTYTMVSSFTFPSMNTTITEFIKRDSFVSERIGDVKGFGFFKGGSSFTSKDSVHLELTIRVYGSNGNFPLEVIVDKQNETYKISEIKILR
ncbi:MAG: hypothetical protein U0W24_08305 [Bacteroidales bacterium]